MAIGQQTPTQGSHEEAVPRPILIAAGAFMACLYAFTMATQWGDTIDFVGDILQASRTGHIGPLFEFGHLLWRPVGLAIYEVLPARAFGWTPVMAGHIGLLLPVMLSGFFCALLFARIAWLVSHSPTATLVTTGAFVCANSFLNWSQTGISYVPGLFLLTAAVWILLRDTQADRLTTKSIILAGLCLAGSILLWFPYITVTVGVALIVLLWEGRLLSQRLWQVVLLSAVTVVTTLAVYLVAIRLNGFSGSAEISNWISGSSHGMHNASLVRFLFAFPRSFLEMGHDGMLFKRYLLHDPFARVSRAELIGTAILKLALFYGFFGYVLFRLLRDRAGHRIFWILTSAALPLFYFAIVLFESGSTERYFPVFPFLVIAVAYTLGATRSYTLRAVCVALLLMASVPQVRAFSRLHNSLLDDHVAASLQAVREASGREPGAVWVPTTLDSAIVVAEERPFHPLNRQHSFPVRQVILVGSDRALRWKKDFAAITSKAMERGEPVWISNRLLAARPERDWNWTEGDVPGVAWHDLRDFFSPFDYAHRIPGPDGFSELANTPANRVQLLKNGSE